MKRKPRKLALHRETIKVLEDPALRRAGGGDGTWWLCTMYCPSDACDTDLDTGCEPPTSFDTECG